MSLKIYLDDCACAKELISLLRTAGHDIVTAADARLAGKADYLHLNYAAAHGLALLTFDADDFAALHRANSQHSGILAVYQDNDRTRDMTFGEVVRAIGNIETAGIELRGTFQSLNAWRY